jgi:carbamate kinase
MRRGVEVVLTHGNGPQVGARLLQQDATAEAPRMPLDVLVAETQGQLGYLLQRELDAVLAGTGGDAPVSEEYVALVTQVAVDPDDPAFDEPTKPVGPWYTADEAAARDFATREVGTGDRRYRRVVPSPAPQRVVERDEIAALLDGGRHVICAGGGGVPVARSSDGGLEGVEAVVDKDATSRLVAEAVDADVLVLATDVDHAYRDWGTGDEDPIERTTPAELRELIDDGAFGAGSMAPKVEAAAGFVEATGRRAAICGLDDLVDAVWGEAGTRVEVAA